MNLTNQKKYTDLLEKFSLFLISEGKSDLTIEAYMKDVKGWLEKNNSTPDEMADHIASLGIRGKASRTISRHASSLRRWGRFLVEHGYEKEDIARLIVNPKRKIHLPTFLVQQQVEDIIESCDQDSEIGIRDATMFQMIYDAGLRGSEALKIKLEDLSQSRTEVIVTGKGSRERVCLLGPRSKEKLEKWIEGPRKEWDSNECPFLFISKKGTPITTRQLRNRFYEAVKSAGLGSGISPHALRHAFATHMLQNGCDIRIVQSLLGHKRISTTQVYTHLAFPDLLMTYRACHPRA